VGGGGGLGASRGGVERVVALWAGEVLVRSVPICGAGGRLWQWCVGGAGSGVSGGWCFFALVVGACG
jgi:hypothetical protein